MSEIKRAPKPIENNDDWLSAASDYYSDIMARYVLGKPLALAEQRLVDILRMRIGTMPESPKRYTERLMREEQAKEAAENGACGGG